MVKSKTPRSIHRCLECGYEAYQWLGKCPDCGAWNSFQEMASAGKTVASSSAVKADLSQVKRLGELDSAVNTRLSTSFSELDHVFGGGLAMPSSVLLVGEPGIGKSTLVLQVADRIAHSGKKVLYISGEEAPEQVRDRAVRLGVGGQEIHIVSEARVEVIQGIMNELQPDVIVVDSIQAVFSERFDSGAGSISQVRESALVLAKTARDLGACMILVGHVTKDGVLAGPRALEHLVDAVFYFEGDRYQSYRMVRSIKNRFGPAGEMCLFDMQGDGLKEVKNPSEIFMSDDSTPVVGRAIGTIVEGHRPLMVEVQALVNQTAFNYPVRRAVGFDVNRLSLLLAVIEKSLGIHLNQFDVFIKVAGGISVQDPAMDLAVVISVLSSLYEKATATRSYAIGEVGLGGEIRKVRYLEKRVEEGARLGFESAWVPARVKEVKGRGKLKVHAVTSIQEVAELAFQTNDIPQKRKSSR